MSTINLSNSKTTSASNIYWDMLKDLSSDIKLKLIGKWIVSLFIKDDSSLKNYIGYGQVGIFRRYKRGCS